MPLFATEVVSDPILEFLRGEDVPATVQGQQASTTQYGIVKLANLGSSTPGLVVQANDPRLSDSRTPTAHENSHRAGGSDELKLDNLGVPDDNTDLDATTLRHGLMSKLDKVKLDAVPPVVGDLLAANNLSDVADAPTSFNNIKQAATTAATGVVELATDGENAAGVVVQGNDSRLSDSRPPNGAAGGVLGGTYPNPSFAVDMATQAELDAVGTTLVTHLADTLNPHNVTKAQVGLANVTDDVQTKAAVVPNTLPASGQVLAGNAGGTAYAPVSVSGDATLTDAGVLTVANDAISNAKLANMAQATIKGRAAAAGTGDPTDLSADQVSTILDAATDPFLRTSDLPAGSGGDVVGPASSTDNTLARWDGTSGNLLKDGLSYGTNPTVNSVAQRDGSARLTADRMRAEVGADVAELRVDRLTFHDFSSGTTATIDVSPGGHTGNNTYSHPDKSGTYAMTSDVPIKAWVNFDGTSSAAVSGTYVRLAASTTVTITVVGHGHIAGHKVFCDFTSGTGLDGTYEVVSVIDPDTFTITTVASTATSGNVTLPRRTILASSNVNTVVYQNTAGRFVVNFSSAMADANYGVNVTCGNTGMVAPQVGSYGGTIITTLAVDILTANLTPAPANVDRNTVQIMR